MVLIEAQMTEEGMLRIGLMTAGGLLLVLATVLAGRVAFGYWRSKQLETTAIRLMQDDLDCAFLTDAVGQVRYANTAAVMRFGNCAGWRLADLFGSFLANPHPFLQRLSHSAHLTGGSKEDVITRSGHFRLSVVVIGPALRLWRMDDLGDQAVAAARQHENLPLPMMTLGPNNAVLHINVALRSLLGRSVANIDDLFDDLPLAPGQRHMLKTAQGPQPVIVAVAEGWGGARDIYLLADQRGDGPRFFTAGWHAIEDLPIPLLKIARSGEILGTNRESRQLLRIVNTDGLKLTDLLEGLGRPINDWLREAFEGRSGRSPQFLQGRGQSQDTFVQVTLNAAGGTTDPHLIAVLDDVTELKSLEAQFVQSQKMQAIGQLAGGVAHDFNNLLTAISGHCDLLLLRHDEGDQNYSDLIQIHQNANRAASLVGQLLAFSRKQTLQPEVIDLRETLSDLTHLLNRLVGEKVTLTLDHDPDLLPIRADKRQLEQVLMNLVVNARDAMQGAGDIRVTTQNLRLRDPMVKDRAVVPLGDYVQVKVIDHGHGISPDKLHKIFEPFYTTKRPGEGTGLGLSTAYGIVKQTGGYIFADSEVGKGTEFTLLFPRDNRPDEPVVVPEPTRREPVDGPATGVVLLVEDEAPVRAFASRALRLRGYSVLEADCAETALAMLEDSALHVDLFVTDVIMPGMDGPTWVRQAREARPDTKVVFISGYAEDAFSDSQPQVANAIFLPKPFSLITLTQTVQDQLAETLPAA
ncbi:ATP-binding protein [Yoonia vestfoldensis]|uniref:histidine kinase n=1 Tax=Yoonia vestfoldensis SKA53 TaxID=314232 RepID=A3V9E5_9RHOB|nr:ATP-binding protein [Yoonia vestfoldensis]EAQ05201.1 sensory box sensor histidine kianse/response regulator [Yoonia vestfoldensis SKA53]